MASTGANKSQQSKIRQMVMQGAEAEQISAKLNIELESVTAWVEHFEEQADFKKAVEADSRKASEDGKKAELKVNK